MGNVVWKLAVGSVLVLVLGSAMAPAAAQNISNEAWIGQIGGVNSLDIIQQGRANSAGADNVFLLLKQDGTGNQLSLDQFGYSNKIGTLFGDEAAYARGVWQKGDVNFISVAQHNAGAGGSNTIGAIQQQSAYNLLTDGANQLRVTQTEEGGLDGTAGHYIGRLVQWNEAIVGMGAAARPDNLAYIVQRGGGDGRGNILTNLYQRGNDNQFGLIQSGQENQVGENQLVGGIWQEGVGNRGWLVQDGEQNLVEYLKQAGADNAARVRLSGNRNAIATIDQDSNATLDGNRVEITISGEDNGSTGAGGVGDFSKPITTNQAGVAQGVFSQFGGDNSIRLTITGGSESKYGVSQVGDGNQAYMSIASIDPAQYGERNETALYQVGSLNVANHTVLGNDNAGAVTQDGKRNRVELVQTGNANSAVVTITGDDNNGAGSTLFGDALDVANMAVTALTPGSVVQVGDDNAITMAVTGSSNGFALEQSGAGNIIDGVMSGNNNALAVVQEAGLNTSLSNQTGNGNALGVHQY